jgi:hypothetical protein
MYDVSNKILTRTNNPIERYTHQLNEKFPCPYPNIWNFIDVIKNEENYYTNLIYNIRCSKIKSKKERKEYKKPAIPNDFYKNNK